MRNLVYNTSAGISILLISLLLGGCEDVFEKDISGLKVNQVSPGDSTRSATNVVSFHWDAIDENSSYRLQVASPDFSNPSRFLLDTLLSGTRFSYTLTQGKYQWRVRGENGSGYTDYSTRTYTVDSITDLSKQVMVLRSPINVALRDTSVSFEWEKIELATSYWLEVRQTSASGKVLYTNDALTGDRTTVGLTEGTFFWSMRASNKLTSNAVVSASFRIDRTPPLPSRAVSPVRDTTIAFGSVTFNWSREKDASVTTDSIMIYNISGIPVSTDYYIPKRYTGTSFILENLPAGNYNWKIFTIDEAGNVSSENSTEAKFVIR